VHWCVYEGCYSQESHKSLCCRFETCRQVPECTDTLRGPRRHGPGEAPVESAAEVSMNGKNGFQPSLQPNPLALLLLHDHTSAMPDATVAMEQPTVHEKTSHGPPTEPTGRPSNGVGWAPIGRTSNTISLERLRDGCTGSAGCQ
jgi:hypothetical protein